MERVSKSEFIKFLTFLSIIFFFIIVFWAKFGLKVAVVSVFLSWSFFVLCIPFSHGKTMLGVPFKFITGRSLVYPEIMMWVLALILNIVVYTSIPWVYFSTFINHLLLRVVSTPWPYWLALSLCFFATFYKFLIGAENFKAKRIRHSLARFSLIILSLITFFYISYNELIILLNIRA